MNAEDIMDHDRKLTVVLALAAGLLGGVLSRYITPPSVDAQTQPAPAIEVRSQRFVVVDPQGRVIGTFTGADTKKGDFPKVVLFDPMGNELWSAEAWGQLRPLTQGSK
jgi:hypothetical protein